MKEVVKVILNTVTIFVSLIALLTIILYLIGIVPTVVSSGSMSPTISTGSLCFVNRNYPFNKLKVNDIIVYYQIDKKVIHRVVRVNTNDVRTKGDNNDFTDRLRATKDNYYGKYMFSIPNIGYYISILQTTAGKFFFIMSIILLYISDYCINRKEE